MDIGIIDWDMECGTVIEAGTEREGSRGEAMNTGRARQIQWIGGVSREIAPKVFSEDEKDCSMEYA